jgi:hypothetical protein
MKQRSSIGHMATLTAALLLSSSSSCSSSCSSCSSCYHALGPVPPRLDRYARQDVPLEGQSVLSVARGVVVVSVQELEGGDEPLLGQVDGLEDDDGRGDLAEGKVLHHLLLSGEEGEKEEKEKEKEKKEKEEKEKEKKEKKEKEKEKKEKKEKEKKEERRRRREEGEGEGEEGEKEKEERATHIDTQS